MSPVALGVIAYGVLLIAAAVWMFAAARLADQRDERREQLREPAQVYKFERRRLP